jgi:preprotein translocase subunit SecY
MASSAEQMAGLNLSRFSQATELKNRIWFTLGALVVFRLLSHVPLPGIDPKALEALFNTTKGGVLDFFNMFSGGSLERMSLIALGVMPYITASIVVQLGTSLSPTLAALKKEGESGRQKLNQYTRYGTVVLSIVRDRAFGRDHVLDVAGRTDHQSWHWQWHFADHHGGHCLNVAADFGAGV